MEKNKDVVGGACIKDENGKIVVQEEKVRDSMRNYLLNEEFDWNIGWHTRSWTILNCKIARLTLTYMKYFYILMYVIQMKLYPPNFIYLSKKLIS